MKTETEPLQRGAPDDPRAEEWREQEGDPDGERITPGRARPAAPDFEEAAERTEISDADQEETMEPMNREQRRHPEKTDAREAAGAGATGAKKWNQ